MELMREIVLIGLQLSEEMVVIRHVKNRLPTKKLQSDIDFSSFMIVCL